LARLVEDGRVENVYRIQLMNATERAQRFRVEVEGLPGAKVQAGADARVGPTEARWLPVGVQVPPEAAAALGAGAHPMRFRIVMEGEGEGTAPAATVVEKSTFVVPR